MCPLKSGIVRLFVVGDRYARLLVVGGVKMGMPEGNNLRASGGVNLIFDWGAPHEGSKFLDVEQLDDALAVRMHPGLSRQQVERAASELGEHGPAVVQAWERHTGFNA